VGDKARIIIKKKIFDKGDVIKSSKELYIVEEIKNNKVKVNGKFYKPYELDRIEDIDIDGEDIEMPVTKTRLNRINQLHKREDVDVKNILTTKRQTKTNSKYL
jgi:hypothetical protein